MQDIGTRLGTDESAELEFARRQDVHTLDAYAWALHVNQWTAEARTQMDRALAVGCAQPRRPRPRARHRRR